MHVYVDVRKRCTACTWSQKPLQFIMPNVVYHSSQSPAYLEAPPPRNWNTLYTLQVLQWMSFLASIVKHFPLPQSRQNYTCWRTMLWYGCANGNGHWGSMASKEQSPSTTFSTPWSGPILPFATLYKGWGACLKSINSKHQHTPVLFNHQWQREGRTVVKNHDIHS